MSGNAGFISVIINPILASMRRFRIAPSIPLRVSEAGSQPARALDMQHPIPHWLVIHLNRPIRRFIHTLDIVMMQRRANTCKGY